MATPDKKPPTKNDKPSDTLKITAEPNTDQAVTLARASMRPSVRAAVTIQKFSKPTFGEVDLTTLADDLVAQMGAVKKGDLQRAEAMLLAQAHSLEAIFHELTRRAGLNLGEYIGAAETYMRLALKAQSQCCRTLETLATIKNPPASVSFVRQANIAHGPQQINNGVPPSTDTVASRARESENQQNKLLEHSNGERLDIGTTAATGRADTQLEAVAAINGAPNRGR